MKAGALSSALSFIESWLGLLHEQGDIPGFVVAIADKGKIVFNKAYGYANLAKKEKLTTDHIFRIASHSKTFTATAIIQLAEAGKLRIDDNAVDYLPWLREHKDKRFSKVTIRQLLSHTAGMIRDGLNTDYWALEYPFPNEKQLKAAILQAGLVFDTNVQMKYSNFGFSLLGLLIESVSGQKYNQYVEQHIVQELRLKNTGAQYHERLKTRIVTGYTREDARKIRLPIVPNIDTKAMSAATGFYSTAQDLCKYLAAHAVGSKQLLDDESKKEMQRTQCKVTNSKQNEEYGLGFAIEYSANKRLVGHSGAFPGQKTTSLIDSKDETIVVVLTNCIDANAKLINKGIFSVLDWFRKASAEGKPLDKLERFQGRFINLWGTAEFIAAGNKIVAIDPTAWQPFDDAQECKYIDNKTLKVTKANGYYSEGELIHFNFTKQGEIKSISFCGETMWAEAEYKKMLAKTTKIG
jgi:CubicO group peptidase (beta-lactamase class C family)